MGSEKTSAHSNSNHAQHRRKSSEAGDSKGKGKAQEKDAANAKRRCVSTACVACRRRKSKCDGNLPSCAACSSVYGTECVYDPNSDHRRKGVYKKDIDNLKTRNTALHTLIQAILTSSESEAIEIAKQIRASDNLDKLAEDITSGVSFGTANQEPAEADYESNSEAGFPQLENEISAKLGGLRLENDTLQWVGGTSNLLHHETNRNTPEEHTDIAGSQQYATTEDAIRSWTTVTKDVGLILHLLNMYFTWHYTYFTILSKQLFFREFYRGKSLHGHRSNEYCTALLVNAMLAVGCHFTSWEAARANPLDPTTAGDHFFKEMKRVFVANDEYESSRLTTVQALAIISAREAGCARETKGWVYSGMSFRMACELGLNVRTDESSLSEYEIDARRITFWGCFLFDKCWSNYLGRSPQLPLTNITTPKFEVFPSEDAEIWSPWTDTGVDRSTARPARTRAVSLKMSEVAEISNDIMLAFYCAHPDDEKPGKQGELKRLSELHSRLEAWRKQVPSEMEPSVGQLPHVLTMHMFFQLLYIHLFRPFLKYAHPGGSLPANVHPRRICIQAAVGISKLLRMYKESYGLKQICNVTVYIIHAASTIHLLNLPDKEAQCGIMYNIQGLEDIADRWTGARKSLVILGMQVQKWRVDLPAEATAILQRAKNNYAHSFSPQASTQGSLSNRISPLSSTETPSDQGHPSHKPSKLHHEMSPDAILSGETVSKEGSFFQRNPSQAPPRQQISPVSSAGLMPGRLSISAPQAMTAGSGSHPGIEGTRDWWLADQASVLDQWTGSSTHAAGSNAGLGWADASMMGLNIDPAAAAAIKLEDIQEDFSGQHIGIEYLDYGPEALYYPNNGGSGA